MLAVATVKHHLLALGVDGGCTVLRRPVLRGNAHVDAQWHVSFQLERRRK